MFQVFSFFIYWLKQVDEHSLHSPFIYDMYTKVIRKEGAQNTDIEDIRDELLKNPQTINVKDLGAGSRIASSSTRAVSAIARQACTPPKFSQLLSRLINHFGHKNILELGTSLGLNTLYMSENPEVRVLTFEGDTSIMALAQSHFSRLNRTNIKSVVGNIDETLEKEINQLERIDLAYLDANHRYEPTLRYYELISTKTHSQSLVVIDDIHWSKEMSLAWHKLKSKPEVTLSIDLFEAGVLFFDPKFQKEDYTLKF